MNRSIVLFTAASLMALPMTATAQANVCPPGEAVGNPNCVRPGVAKKFRENRRDARQDRRDDLNHPVLHDLAIGKILDRDYAEVVEFERLGLPRPRAGTAYWQVNDLIVAVDKDSREVRRIFPDPR